MIEIVRIDVKGLFYRPWGSCVRVTSHRRGVCPMRPTTHSLGSIRKGAVYVSNEVIKYSQEILGDYYIELLKIYICGRPIQGKTRRDQERLRFRE